ncbi:uncharacterized protein LOC144806458 [Lissotriton helveticus]
MGLFPDSIQAQIEDMGLLDSCLAYTQGDKVGKHLARQLKDKRERENIGGIRDGAGNLQHRDEDKADLFGEFYASLYTADTPDADRQSAFLRYLPVPQVPTEWNEVLVAPITLEEVLAAIKSLKAHKAPGIDGYTAVFYKTFATEIAPHLVNLFNCMAAEGNSAASMNEAVISTATRILENYPIDTYRSLPKTEGVYHEVILMLGSEEMVKSSGEYLFQKESGTSRQRTLMEWNENTQHFNLLRTRGANTVELSPHTKLLVLGHGRLRDGDIRLGGKTSRELADSLLSLSTDRAELHMSKKRRTLREVSLVSCDVGEGPEGGRFVEELLVNMREGGLEVGSVSARTVYTYVLPDGTKRTAESEASELWSHHSPKHKRTFYLGENNKLHETTDSSGRSHQWHEEQKQLSELEPLAPGRPWNDPLFVRDGGTLYKIDNAVLSEIIDSKVKALFASGEAQITPSEESVPVYRPDGTTETSNVRTVRGMDDLRGNIQEIIHTTNRIRKDMLLEHGERLRKEGIVDNNFNLKTTWGNLEEHAHMHNNPRNFFKWLQRNIASSLSNRHVYYKFKDFVYRMNLHDFYFEYYGALREGVDVDQNMLNKLAYADMGNMGNKDGFVEMAKNWVDGNHEVIDNNINIFDGMAVLATHISEPVRNPRVFITNRLMWDATSSWSDFRNRNPMARGRTWQGNKAAIGLEHEPNAAVHDDTLATVKLWLTRKYRGRFTTSQQDNAEKASGELIGTIRTDILNTLPTQNTDIDTSMRPYIGPLSEKDVGRMQVFEEAVRGRSLQPQLLLKTAEDQQHLQEKIRDIMTDQRYGDLSDYRKVRSLEKYSGGLKLSLQSTTEPMMTKEIIIPGEAGTSKSEELMHSYFSDVHSSSSKINHGLGIYGSLMGFQAANQMFSQGRDWEGGVMVAQGVHGVTELSGVNAVINDFISSTSKQAVAKNSEKLEGVAAAKFTNSLSSIGKAAESIPVLSVAFTVFNIYEDIKQDSAIGFVDATLDGTILVTSLLGPEMLPVTVALTIIRLGIDPLYHEIKHELDSLPPNASGGQRFVAVLKGIVLAVRDIIVSFVEIINQFNIFHTFSEIYELEEEHRKSMQLVDDLKTPDNYFKVKEQGAGDGCHTMIDFTQGKDSGYGGDLYVELTDHNSMIVTIDDPVTPGRLPKEYPFQRGCETVDIILGFGQSVKVAFVKKSATFLWIPVKKEDVIGSMVPDESSLHGTYKGNSKPNRFYAVQQRKPPGLHYSLDTYFYTLFGNNGNDFFFLGPQRSLVHGGNGQDVYFIPEDGGDTDICNQAEDQAMDLVIINIKFIQISARKEGQDLKLFYNNNHHIVIRSWFMGDSYQHLSFKSRDGALFKVGKVLPDGRVTLEVTVLDYSRDTEGCNVNLKLSPWERVIFVKGSDYDDVILGNEVGNVLQGGKGVNLLTGGNGKDMYVLEEKETCDTINNQASDGEIDTVQIAAEYKNVKVAVVSTSSIKVWDSAASACVIIKGWKLGWEWQHIIFQTKDFVIFQVSNTTAEPKIVPLIMDFHDSETGVSLDLNTIPGNEHIMTVIGSSFQDVIIGNRKPNFFGGGDGDFLKGGDGRDTYTVDCKTEQPAIINNYAEDSLPDVLFLKEKFSTLRYTNPADSPDVIIRGRRCVVRLQNWHLSEQNRHLWIQTEDGITFELGNGNVPLVYAVDYSTSDSHPDTIDTRTGVYSRATKIIGPTKFVAIWGNEKDNFIDPGSGGAFMSGLSGKDTYILKAEYHGRYVLDNFAEDQSIDFLILDAEFKAINIARLSETDLLISVPPAARWTCELKGYIQHKEQRHLIMQSRDKVWFTVSEESLRIQPLFLDRKDLPTDLHLKLSDGHLRTIPTVYGSVRNRNTIMGNDLKNALVGGKDTDVLAGLGGNDLLQGSDGTDYLSGGTGDDEVHGGEGDDYILAGAGDDVIYPGPGSDKVYGGSGSDTVLFSGNHTDHTGVLVNLGLGYGTGADAEGDLYFSVENVLGTSYNDILVGSDKDNYLSGEGGSDLILPMGGSDVLHGGEGSDIYYLREATGLKRIDNFSKDKAMDMIYFGTVGNDEIKHIQFRKLEDDLEITFPNGTDTDFLEGVLIKNWFKSVHYRHVLIMYGKIIPLFASWHALHTFDTCVITVTSSDILKKC